MNSVKPEVVNLMKSHGAKFMGTSEEEDFFYFFSERLVEVGYAIPFLDSHCVFDEPRIWDERIYNIVIKLIREVG